MSFWFKVGETSYITDTSHLPEGIMHLATFVIDLGEMNVLKNRFGPLEISYFQNNDIWPLHGEYLKCDGNEKYIKELYFNLKKRFLK